MAWASVASRWLLVKHRRGERAEPLNMVERRAGATREANQRTRMEAGGAKGSLQN